MSERGGEGPGRGSARGMDSLPGGVVFALALVAVVGAGLADERMGDEVQATPLYLVPVWLASRFLGAGAGLAAALAAAVASWSAGVATRAYAPRPAVQVVNFATELAVFVVVAMLIAALRARVRGESSQARTDALTGLLNRRGFLEAARREVARAARTGRPLTVALADVDSFQEVNDVRGHEAGDHLLGSLSAALRSSMRAVDVCARLDGDKFAVLLPDTDPASVEAVLDRLRFVLVQAAADKGVPATVSLGAATFHRPPMSLDEMLRAAGRMLREAKVDGRDGVRHDRIDAVATGA